MNPGRPAFGFRRGAVERFTYHLTLVALMRIEKNIDPVGMRAIVRRESFMAKALQRMIAREPDLRERPHSHVRGRSKKSDIEAQNTIPLEARDQIIWPPTQS
jgi:hypothetical protein